MMTIVTGTTWDGWDSLARAAWRWYLSQGLVCAGQASWLLAAKGKGAEMGL